MTQLDQQPASSAKTHKFSTGKFSVGPLLALGGVVASLAIMASLYLGHDIIKGRVSPCEAIFAQTSIGLSTKIKLLKAEGALQIGREALTDLSERAQMVALNLKTCCTVLDAGRVNPEEFLQCKSKARQYDAKVQEVVTLVDRSPPVETGSTNSADAAGASPLPPPASAAVEKAVDEARTVSQDFNKRVVEVRKAQALESLEALPDAQVEISAAEREPNDDAFNANVIPLGTWAKAAINPVSESDYFTFTTPETYRDWIRIEAQNRSTSLHPRLQLFDAKKSSIANPYNATAGGDLSYDFVAAPGSRYTLKFDSYYGKNTGVYLIRVSPQKAYDAHEPNDDVLTAKAISANTEIEAKIMDGRDVDYFASANDKERDVTVTLKNKSASLHPRIVVYNASKSEVAHQYNATAGGDLTVSVKAPAGPVYVRVSDYYDKAGGAYALTIGE